MRILQVSAELFPLLKTGGLADIAGALPLALMAAGQDARALLPGFPAIVAGVRDLAPVAEFTAPWGERFGLRAGHVAIAGAPPLPTYVIDAPALYDRPGNPYEDTTRQPYSDNHRRFALLGWAAAQLAQGLDPAWRPDVVHAHDWHAALAPAYLAFARRAGGARTGTVFTVHNLAYQGLFAPKHFAELGLPPSAFHMNGLEYHGQVSFMKGGLCFADQLTTVSPTYALEIQTPEQGCGLDGLLRQRSNVLSGILNAVDDQVWNPSTDAALVQGYQTPEGRHMAGKARCKSLLQRQLGLAERADAPLFIVVSRLTEQKGLHLVLGGLDRLLAQGGQLALLGSGEGWLEDAFRQRAAAAPESVSVTIGYDEALAHQLFGAGDVTLVPSLFEPCGLTQMYGLKYGSLPLVRRVGGLADTVVDCTLEDMASGAATGFVFDRFEDADYDRALRRAFALYGRAADWRRVRANAMRRPADWGAAAAQYIDVYQRALA
ncbi:glycogen synthase GlgA [Variovorax paradoxus]|uniref:Glycogen synthase n=1 Tax=Variovorax paradoxus TaxID=34073 RepID=A0A5Q0M0S2_VARPD|nr:glycogen synthase GlgA [Variovorax paradoxus]QFZ82135.1 glycogen synthase GlgA [Variovorax paradoxus]